jgi:2-C-methyl-D-erythritol 4-phosphate cytidylyltransferase
MQRIAIILAGGAGTRTQLSEPKQYFVHNGMSILEHLISRVSEIFDQLLVVNRDESFKLIHHYENVAFVPGGDTRLASIQNGIQAVANLNDSIVMIHDAARPMIGEKVVEDHLAALSKGYGTISVIRLSQGILIGEQRTMTSFYSHKTSEIYQAMLPQFYHGADLLENMMQIMAVKEDLDIPEILQSDLSFRLVEVDHHAEKITYYDDIKKILDSTQSDL